MVEKWDITIPELAGDQPRSVYVYLPESYEYEPEKRYPVLYMFDGHNVFFDQDATYGKSWGMKEYMDATETQMIIAAVECSHDPDNGRLREYSPFWFTDPKTGTVDGQGHITMDWLVGVFKPEIDEKYRTLPDRAHTFIAGSSMGGLMSLYAILCYNSYFSKAAALSPSIWLATDKIENMILDADIQKDTTIYMDYGSREIRHHSNMEYQFGKVTSLLLQRHIWLTARIVPKGDHCEASWEKQIPFFINTLLY
jgi:predicted alpha/beta superfamily hydrolase